MVESQYLPIHRRNSMVNLRPPVSLLFRRVREVSVQVLDGRPLVVTRDGECEERMSLNARVSPAAARVLVPAGML